VLDRLGAAPRAAAEFVGRRALARATRAVPRTLHFVGSALWNGEVAESLPAPRLSVGLAAQVAMDEVLLAMAMTPSRFPRHEDYVRVAREMADAEALYSELGWLDDPASYHRTPPPLDADDVTSSHGWALGLGYRRLSWESGYAPHPADPGGERWMAFEPNRTASAVVVSHDDGPRPWVVAVHGFCMGFPFMDFQGLGTARLHRDLGFNVAMPTLPLHGPRRVTLVSGEPFLSFELMNAVHGLTQAAWDVRRLVDWIREQGASSITLYGVSLGAYAVSLLAGLDDRFDGVVAGVPVSDFPGLFHRHSPQHVRARAIEHEVMGTAADRVFRVVSPLSFGAKVPHQHRYIFAGYGDRLALPDQAQALWQHWEQPSISWYSGNHVGYLWSKKVSRFVAASLTEVAASGAPVTSRS
jgi:dienelactone hydrolase